MGVRGELFSTKVSLQNRTYFFNVKENRLGDLYLNIVESKNRDEGGFERQSVILFAEDLQEFLKGFDQSLRVMEKSVREKRKGTDRQFGDRQFGSRQAGDHRSAKSFDDKPAFRQRPSRRDERTDSYGAPPRRSRDDSRGYGGRGRDEDRGGRFTERPERRSDRPAVKRSTGRSGAERSSDRPDRRSSGGRSFDRSRPREERDSAFPRKKRVVVRRD